MTILEIQLALRREFLARNKAAQYPATYCYMSGESYDPEKLIDLLLAELKMQQ